MRIEKLQQKIDPARAKHGMGYNFEKEGVLLELNLVIDWENSILPEELGDKDITEMSLEIGDTFMLYGEAQIIAIKDENTLILVASETGPVYLKRLYEEVISPELKRILGSIEGDVLEHEMIPYDISLLANLKFITPSYKDHKIWRERYFRGKEEDPSENLIRIRYNSDILLDPIELIIYDWRLYYDPNIFEETDTEILLYVVEDVYQWFFDNTVPLPYPIIEKSEEDLDENFVEFPG